MLPVIFFKNIDFMYHHYEWVFSGLSHGSSVFLIMIFSSMLSVFIALMFKFGYRDQKSLFGSINTKELVLVSLVLFTLILIVGDALMNRWFLNYVNTILLFLTSYGFVVVLAGVQLNIFWALSNKKDSFS
jgi:hypothetical protein